MLDRFAVLDNRSAWRIAQGLLLGNRHACGGAVADLVLMSATARLSRHTSLPKGPHRGIDHPLDATCRVELTAQKTGVIAVESDNAI